MERSQVSNILPNLQKVLRFSISTMQSKEGGQIFTIVHNCRYTPRKSEGDQQQSNYSNHSLILSPKKQDLMSRCSQRGCYFQSFIAKSDAKDIYIFAKIEDIHPPFSYDRICQSLHHSKIKMQIDFSQIQAPLIALLSTCQLQEYILAFSAPYMERQPHVHSPSSHISYSYEHEYNIQREVYQFLSSSSEAIHAYLLLQLFFHSQSSNVLFLNRTLLLNKFFPYRHSQILLYLLYFYDLDLKDPHTISHNYTTQRLLSHLLQLKLRLNNLLQSLIARQNELISSGTLFLQQRCFIVVYQNILRCRYCQQIYSSFYRYRNWLNYEDFHSQIVQLRSEVANPKVEVCCPHLR